MDTDHSRRPEQIATGDGRLQEVHLDTSGQLHPHPLTLATNARPCRRQRIGLNGHTCAGRHKGVYATAAGVTLNFPDELSLTEHISWH